jgi:integration host factor subunit beta
MKQMNKSKLVEALSNEGYLSIKEASGVIDTILDTMSDALSRGESIEIRGFGSFSVKQYGSYEGRNPKTGEIVNVKPKKLPVFKVGRQLRIAVDQGRSDR